MNEEFPSVLPKLFCGLAVNPEVLHRAIRAEVAVDIFRNLLIRTDTHELGEGRPDSRGISNGEGTFGLHHSDLGLSKSPVVEGKKK